MEGFMKFHFKSIFYVKEEVSRSESAEGQRKELKNRGGGKGRKQSLWRVRE